MFDFIFKFIGVLVSAGAISVLICFGFNKTINCILKGISEFISGLEEAAKDDFKEE